MSPQSFRYEGSLNSQESVRNFFSSLEVNLDVSSSPTSVPLWPQENSPSQTPFLEFLAYVSSRAIDFYNSLPYPQHPSRSQPHN